MQIIYEFIEQNNGKKFLLKKVVYNYVQSITHPLKRVGL